MVLKVNVVRALHLEAVHGFSCLGDVELVAVIVRHNCFLLKIYFQRRSDFSACRRISSVRRLFIFMFCKFCQLPNPIRI